MKSPENFQGGVVHISFHPPLNKTNVFRIPINPIKYSPATTCAFPHLFFARFMGGPSFRFAMTQMAWRHTQIQHGGEEDKERRGKEHKYLFFFVCFPYREGSQKEGPHWPPIISRSNFSTRLLLCVSTRVTRKKTSCSC